MPNFKPLHDNILIAPLQAENRSEGGIFIPENAKEKPTKGKVVAVGPGRANDQGNRAPLDVKVGDVVIHGKYAGIDLQLHGEEYKMLKEEDILGIVEE